MRRGISANSIFDAATPTVWRRHSGHIYELRTDLDQFPHRLISDQALIGAGVTSVCRKLPRF
jgi:hypothetical protein